MDGEEAGDAAGEEAEGVVGGGEETIVCGVRRKTKDGGASRNNVILNENNTADGGGGENEAGGRTKRNDAPGENKKSEADGFFEQLARMTTELQAEGGVMIIGDLNARAEEMGGTEGNRNGNRVARLMQRCEMERVKPQEERVTCFVGAGSRIDHVLAQEGRRRRERVEVSHERVMQSDHAQIEVTRKVETRGGGKKRRRNNKGVELRSVRGKEEEYAREVEKSLREKGMRKGRTIRDAQTNITVLKTVLKETAERVCGTRRTGNWREGGGRRGQTSREQEDNLDKLWREVWREGGKCEGEYKRWRKKYEEIQVENERRGRRQRNEEISLMEECMLGDMEDFWKLVQKAMGIEGREPIAVLRNQEGDLEEGQQGKMKIMKTHYENLGKGGGQVKRKGRGRNRAEDDEVTWATNNKCFMMEEWERAKRKVRGKSKARGKITAAMVKCQKKGGEADRWGLEWANGIWECSEWTREEKDREIVSIYKKRGRQRIENYRGIVLVEVYGKILEAMIDESGR